MKLNLKKKPKIKTSAMLEREARQLRRLEVLMDVLFALMVWRAIQFLPQPRPEEWKLGKELFDILLNYPANFQIVLIGTVLTLTYWGQNNLIFGNLSRTDARHASFSILQTILLLIYGYFARLGVEFEGDPSSLALQSIALALAGFMAMVGWSYAMYERRLLTDTITNEEAHELRAKVLAEPLAAVCSIPFAWVGSAAWTLAFLAGMIVFGWLLKRWQPAPQPVTQAA